MHQIKAVVEWLLQCGHAGTRVETGCPPRWAWRRSRGFNAATREPAWRPVIPTTLQPAVGTLQCGHAGTRVETRERRSPHPPGEERFNAATREPAWRRQGRVLRRRALLGASMRPRGNPRGDQKSSSWSARARASFNAATREPAWRPAGQSWKMRPSLPQLQCGHAGTRVETRSYAYSETNRSRRFNAATREPAWRPSGPRRGRMDCVRLQCGHAGTRVETSGECEHAGGNVAASMRPRGNPRGDLPKSVAHACAPRSFNAATREPAWRPSEGGGSLE